MEILNHPSSLLHLLLLLHLHLLLLPRPVQVLVAGLDEEPEVCVRPQLAELPAGEEVLRGRKGAGREAGVLSGKREGKNCTTASTTTQPILIPLEPI